MEKGILPAGTEGWYETHFEKSPLKFIPGKYHITLEKVALYALRHRLEPVAERVSCCHPLVESIPHP